MRQGLLALLLLTAPTASGSAPAGAGAAWGAQVSGSASSAPSPAQAEGAYRERLKSNPHDVEALLRLAELTDNPSQCSQSVASARQGLSLVPDDADLRLQLGRSLATCREETEAVAVYRKVIMVRPNDARIEAELGDLLLRLHRDDEAATAFRRAHTLDPSNAGATLGLASALVATGNYGEALANYDQALKAAPGNYDALQGKAYLLYWSHRFAEARAIFSTLEREQPADPSNAKALADIAAAEDEARWSQLRPKPNAPPRDYVAYYDKVLAANPNDKTALLGLAFSRAQMKDYTGAIVDYRRVLDLYPGERNARLELARLLGIERNYKASIRLYKEALNQTPDDPDILQGLARVYTWSGHLREAALAYVKLCEQDPRNLDYRLEIARVHLASRDYPLVRDELAQVLTGQPANLDARLMTAELDLRQHEYEAAGRQFNQVLSGHPSEPEALLGKARLAYYNGDLATAESITRKLVADHPDDYEAIMLLAGIDRARRNRQEALSLLGRAERLSPRNPEVESLRDRVIAEAPLSIHTAFDYNREIAQGGGNTPFEDLRTFAYGTTFDLMAVPRSQSTLAIDVLPTETPYGGLRGVAVPSQFMYRQSTRVDKFVTARGGLGAVRFGSGDLFSVPTQSEQVRSAGSAAIGYAGVTVSPLEHVSLDLTWSLLPAIYTPLSARLGVTENRWEGTLNLTPDPRTQLHFTYYQSRYSTEGYPHYLTEIEQGNTVTLTPRMSDHDNAKGGVILFNRTLYRERHLAFEGGYWGLAYAFDHPAGTFLGFFNPSFYQRHFVTGHAYGNIHGPLGYDVTGDFGLQQIGHGGPLTRAYIVTPGISLRASEKLAITIGYTHYDVAQAIGTVRGNGVTATTDWKF